MLTKKNVLYISIWIPACEQLSPLQKAPLIPVILSPVPNEPVYQRNVPNRVLFWSVQQLLWSSVSLVPTRWKNVAASISASRYLITHMIYHLSRLYCLVNHKVIYHILFY